MTHLSQDRRVHAVLSDGGAVVRYDRAGKWFVEYPSGRRSVSVREAARLAAEHAETVYTGLPGGRTFDRIVWGQA